MALEAPPSPSNQAVTPTATSRGRFWRRPLAACALLFVVYVALSFLNDPRGTLGTDTGGKLATLAAMEESGRAVPDVGYWAAASDPSGVLHPLYYTKHVGDHWVNVTTLPMLYAGWPLYQVGGERALLLLPMLGGVLCALAARRLARLLGGDGMAAFWAVGLATPVAVYALDFWEHTLGLACMVFAVAILVEIARGTAGARAALGAGALFGLAATMRTESLVYLAVATAVVLAMRLVARAHVTRVVVIGAAVGGGAAAVVFANQLVERLALGSSVRTGRAAGTASAAGAGIAGRIGEAFTTTVGLNGLRPPVDVIAGGAIVALVALAVLALGFREEPSRVVGIGALTIAGVVFVARFGDGFGFVPGFLAASPLAVVGLCFRVAGAARAHSAARCRAVTAAGLVTPVPRWRTSAMGWPVRAVHRCAARRCRRGRVAAAPGRVRRDARVRAAGDRVRCGVALRAFARGRSRYGAGHRPPR